MNRGNSLRWAMLTVLAVLLSACATLRPQPPEVSVRAVRLLSAGFAEQNLAIVLKIENPNRREFVLSELDYQLELGGNPFARGRLERQVTLPANAETEVEVPAKTRLADFLGSSAGKLLLGAASGKLDYRLSGTARIDGLWSGPFDRRGSLDLFRNGRGGGQDGR